MVSIQLVVSVGYIESDLLGMLCILHIVYHPCKYSELQCLNNREEAHSVLVHQP
jgi:hypothetical protein